MKIKVSIHGASMCKINQIKKGYWRFYFAYSKNLPVVTRCHGLRVYPVCVCNTVRLGQVRSRHNLKPSSTRFECVSGLSV